MSAQPTSYESLILSLYIFLLIFMINIVTQLPTDPGKEKIHPKILYTIHKTFNKKDDTNYGRWVNFFNDLELSPQTYYVNLEALLAISNLIDAKVLLTQAPTYKYIISIETAKFFESETEYFSSQAKIFIQEFIKLAKFYRNEFDIEISWAQKEGLSSLEYKRLELIYNQIYSTDLNIYLRPGTNFQLSFSLRPIVPSIY